MAVREISQAEFAALNLVDHCQAHWPEEQERAWFIDAAEKVVGALLFDTATDKWGYSICSYRDDGQFHRIAVGSDFRSAEMARSDLLANMRRVAVA